MNQLKYCYHTHTSRCGHAFGKDEEYVVKAIELGITRLGFSDHVFMSGTLRQEGIRGTFGELEDYCDSVAQLREKFKQYTHISCGFEAEYDSSLVPLYEELLNDRIQYLILGQHCYVKDGEWVFYFFKDCGIEYVKKYVDDVIEGLKTGLFKYLCHPDLFMHSQKDWNKELERESVRLLKACEKMNIPLEVNICGMRKQGYNEVNYSYPNISFFKLASKYNVKFILGVDAHNPSHFNQKEIDQAVDFANRCGIQIDWDYVISNI